MLLSKPVWKLDDAHDNNASCQDLSSSQIMEVVLLNVIHEGLLVLWLCILCDADHDPCVNPVQAKSELRIYDQSFGLRHIVN